MDAKQVLAAAELEHTAAREAYSLAQRRWDGESARTVQAGMQSAANILERSLSATADVMHAHGSRRYEPQDRGFVEHLFAVQYASRAA
ncbi:hypothetical protein F2Q65_13610 [Thiohalocapsa marina]|uniref:Uncharacterized protein n=1 Tax=Thiohalocapsa marina TaxID=424902 RepID=A0A5M8FGV5_9GAMM|nr:hypothetical protein [Thiohalocapsa marina]KAA6184103.1 hypothetical protein F2Q65_13610 [Thiohalocapsa marina]